MKKGDEVIEMPVWYTDEIMIAQESPGDQFQGKIKGLPLEYSTTVNGMDIKVNVEKVELIKIENSTFDIPTDYERMTMEEFQAKMSNSGKE